MITRTLLILLFLFLISFGSNAQTTIKTGTSAGEFTENPWPFEPSLTEVQNNYGNFLKKEKYAVKNRLEPSHKDTIVRLFKGKTEIFFYQPYNGKPLFVTANLYDKRFRLKGDITTGLTSQDICNRVHYPKNTSDTLVISLPGGFFKTTIVFREDKASVIKIEAKKVNR